MRLKHEKHEYEKTTDIKKTKEKNKSQKLSS